MVKRGNTKKIGYYELIAEMIAPEAEDEDYRERGKRLEPEAMEVFKKETGKNVDSSLIMWEREDNPRIAISPDGQIGKTEAVEIKCLSASNHIKAYLTKKVPAEFSTQALQYFVVNDKLKTLYFVFYNPDVPPVKFFFLEVKRADHKDEIKSYLEYQVRTLAEVDEIVNKLTF